jgi:predicted nucleic acid-binding protein
LGTLALDLAAHHTVGIDTAPFIYLWERHVRYAALADVVFEHLDRPDVQGITSIITLIEALILPQREGRRDLIQAYERALLYSRQVTMLPVDVTLARGAVALRARYDILLPDALQIAAALEAGATAFVTNDRRLSRVDDLSVIILEDYAG